jgi:hypothetical protein
MNKTRTGPNESMDEFKEMYGMTMELEKALLIEHAKIGNAGKRLIQLQYDQADKMIAMRFGDAPMKAVKTDAAPEIYKYKKKLFKFLVAKDAGVFKVIHLTVDMDEDFDWLR